LERWEDRQVVGSGRESHYDVLGVTSDAPEEVIRAAYRALAAKYHPDRNPEDSDAELKLKRLNAAFQVLGDPAKRKQYDELARSPEGRDEYPLDAQQQARYDTARPRRPDAPASRVGFAKRSGFWVTMAVLSVVAMAGGLPRFIGGVCLLVSVLGLMGSREAR
jgi:curved DNA-binding protein CbpA